MSENKVTKIFDPADLQLDPGSRTVIATISTDGVDRQGEVVLPKGLMKKNYSGNPVVMSNHDYQTLPIGVCEWIKPDSRDARSLIAKYKITDKTEMGRDVWALMSDDPPVLRAHSIGFQVYEASPPTPEELEQRPEWKAAKSVIRKWEMLEFSVVGIPANPDCLALCHSKGLVSQATLDFINKDWQRPSPWQYKPTQEKPQEQQEKTQTPTQPTPATISIPTPTFSRNYASIEQRIKQSVLGRRNLAKETQRANLTNSSIQQS